MGRQDYRFTAPPGSIIWNWIGDTLNLGPGINARPAWLRFRTTLLSSGAPQQTDPTNPRVNPDFDFVWTRTSAYIVPGANDGPISHLAYFQLRGNQGFDIFDRPQPFSAYGYADAGATAPSVSNSGGFNGVPVEVPYVFAAGESINCQFTCEATLPGTSHVAEVILAGVYVSKNLQIDQPPPRVEMALRMGKSLRRFLEMSTVKRAPGSVR